MKIIYRIMLVLLLGVSFACTNRNNGKSEKEQQSDNNLSVKLSAEDIYKQSINKVAMVLSYKDGIPSSQGSGFFIDKNTLVTNYPCESPFILKDENGMRKEIRWYINGHWISHFYRDENNYNNIKEILLSQQKQKESINPMSYIEWGLPSTVSLGLSIDRWLQMLLDINNINSIANPIVLDYPKTRRLK